MKYDMKVIGLTGGIATGKTTVSNLIKDLGLPLVDADILAREVVGPGSFGLKALVEVFGSEILKKSGASFELDRPKLAQKLFSDPSCRLVVENIVHPLIQWRANQEFGALKNQGKKIVFYDAALIFEKELHLKLHSVIVVHTGHQLEAALKIQIQRLMARDKLSFEKAKERVNSQMPMADKIKAANHLIDNSEGPKKTEEQVRELIRRLTSP
jgi:dephospho-CoA kinase